VVDKWPGREWLEAALLAGHVPYQEGIVLALRADHLWWLALLKDEGPDDGLIESLVDTHRKTVTMLEGFIVELERYGAAADESSTDRPARRRRFRRRANP
jgi:hypothetical protein